MFIKRHLLYWAICLFLFVLSFGVHKVFIFVFLVFLIFFINKTSILEVLLIILSIICVYTFLPDRDKDFHDVIEGKVVECDRSSAIVKCKNQNVKVYHSEKLRYGDKVKMKLLLLEINSASNDNGFDEEMYFKANDIDIKAKCVQLLSQEHQYNFVNFIESRLSDNEIVKSYQRLFILGIRDEFIEDDYQRLLSLSVVHLFALSGMHLHYLRKMITQLFSNIITKRNIDIVIYIFLFLYIINIPFSISLYRAYFMMLLYDCFKRYLNKLDVYCIVFIFFLLKNPYYLYNYSFIFSFGVYLIVLLTQGMKYQDFYVYLFSLPIIIYMQNRIYLVSFLFSLLLSTFIEVFYQMILLSIPISLFNKILNIMILLLNNMVDFVSIFDYQLVFAKPPISFIALFYIISFIIIMRKQIKLKVSFHYSLLLSLLISCFVHGQYPLYASVTMIDVGQGDCTLIRLPFGQGNILIDTGGSYDYDIATTILIPYFHSIGVDSLDYVYVSHDDFDHAGALESLINNFCVKNIVRDFEEKRIIGDLTIEMLKPSTSYSESNDQSLIMRLSLYDFNFLFMGDASIKVEEDLYDKYGKMDIDVLKVSHHGSKTSTGVKLLTMINPKIAMIGVKKNNLYGHPSQSVIERLERKGVTILRTDLDGMFHLRFYNNNGYILR